MKTIGNVCWMLFTGLFQAIGWCVIGAMWCITVIGIPFGLQAFKIAKLVIWPFGNEAKIHFDKHPIANIFWLVFGGLELAIGFLVTGVLWCITIIGIPFGMQCFKFVPLACFPFGATIGKK